MEVEQQQHHVDSREPVTSVVVKPHEMSLDGDLTSQDDVTHQQHLSAKSPMSDDSGVVIDENHMEQNGSVPMTPEGEETRWEEGHQGTNGAWPDDDRRGEQPIDAPHDHDQPHAHHDTDAVFTEPAAGETNAEAGGTAEETSMLEVARPTVDSDAAAAAAGAPAVAEPTKDEEVAATEHHDQQHQHQPADEAAAVEQRTTVDESAPSAECRREEVQITTEEEHPRVAMETDEPIIEAGESKVEEAEPKIEQAESKVEEVEPFIAEPAPVEPEPEPEPEPVDDDKDRIDFVPGVHCDNVLDALSILKNKYRLSRSVSKKNVITFSCWNLKDVTNTPSHVVNANRMSQPVPEEDERMIDILDDILSKEKEIDRLLEQVLEKERENDHKTAEAKRLSAKQGGGGAENDLPIIEESLLATDVATSPALESAPPQAASSSPNAPGNQSKEDMKKKRSRLVRMLQALRRRLGGRR